MNTSDAISSARFPGNLVAGASAVSSGFRAIGGGAARIGARHGHRCWIALMAALGMTIVIPTSASRAQAPPLGATANFSILSGAGITNTGFTVISGTAALPGDIGSSSATITGFPPGTVIAPGAIHTINDAPTITARNSETVAYNNLAGRITTANLTGQNLGGLTLIPGVYNFSSSAQLTGILNLNGLGNPNSVFIFNIGSTLTTASASVVSLINGAQGGNVFWRVGSSATLGTTPSFAGDILAQASITLNTGAGIACGAAWAGTGAVTLDTNRITLCDLIGGNGAGALLGPTGVPLIASLLLPSASTNRRSVGDAIDGFVGNGGPLPLVFLNLFNLAPTDLGNALTQLSGEAGTAITQVGIESMNSFLALVTNPFADRGFAPQIPLPRPALVYKAPFYKGPAVVADPRRWGIWAAAYGGQNNTAGNAMLGSHDSSARSYGFATGLDYRVTPYTVAGFALGGGSTNYGFFGRLRGGPHRHCPGRRLQSDACGRGLRIGSARLWISSRVNRPVRDGREPRPPDGRFLRQQRRRPDRGRLSFRHSGAVLPAGVRDHALRRLADAGVPHAVLQ